MKSVLRNIIVGSLIASAAAGGVAGASHAGSDPVKVEAQQQEAELLAFKRAIRAKYDLKEKAFAENDADAIADEFYSKDVVSVDPSGKVTLGREALRKAYEHIVPTATVKVESINTFVEGDAGWDWTNFHVTPTNPEEKPFSFIILFLWAKEKGEWICKGDMYVTGSI